MIVWLTDSSSCRRASGSCTLKSVCARVAPNALAASTVSRGDAADAERGDAHGGRDRVDHRADHRRRRADREQDHDRHQVGERGHDLHRVERRRDARGGSARERPATIADRHRRSTSESSTAASISASVWMLSSHSPISANETNAASDDQRRAASRRSAARSATDAAIVPTQVSHSSTSVMRRDEPVGERAEAVEDREDDVRVVGGALRRAASPGASSSSLRAAPAR